MCNFIRSNNEQCKISPKKDRCYIHTLKVVEVAEELVEEVIVLSTINSICSEKNTVSNIISSNKPVDTMSPLSESANSDTVEVQMDMHKLVEPSNNEKLYIMNEFNSNSKL